MYNLYQLLLLAAALSACVASSKPSTLLDADVILDRSVKALGGLSSLQAIKGISYHHYLYRTQSLEESKVPGIPDQAVATTGLQTVSYDFTGNTSGIVQRIDRKFSIGNFWVWARPELEPTDMTLIVRGGKDGYSCYRKGNEIISLPPNATYGYTDGFLTGVLVRDAERLSPTLVLQMHNRKETIRSLEVYYHGAGPFPAVYDSTTNFTVLFDPVTYLPHVIRTYEDHMVFGNSTNDFVLFNYTTVGGMQVPQTIQLLYNEDQLLMHTFRGSITVDPSFPNAFFEGIPMSEVNQTASGLGPMSGIVSAEYGAAEVFENNMNQIWYGPSKPSLKTIVVTQPIPQLPNLYHIAFEGSFYTHTVGVFEDAVMVTESAPHQSKVVIQWIKEVLHRNVTHLLVSHHHHDHNYGANDFVEAGAKLVVPEEFAYYWKSIPGVKFATVTEERPFKHKDSKLQIRAVWHRQNVHSDDWMYFVWTEACPKADSPLAVVLADVWSPGFAGYLFEQTQAVNYLALAVKDHMPYNYTVLPVHGDPTPITALYEALGYSYPKYTTKDFLPGGAL